MTHDELCLRAEKWLKSQNCGVVFHDRFQPYTPTGEQPDAIGFRDGLSIMVECKTSRADFHADKKKKFRSNPELGMGDWRFYMCPPGVITEEDLPTGWGLLYCYPKQIKRIVAPKGSRDWYRRKPFTGNKVAESYMMISALRRLAIRGRLDEIYEGPVPKEQRCA